MNKTIILDIDGTVANAERRKHWIATQPRNWKAFFADIEEDELIEPVAEVIKHLAKTYDIVVCTGRAEEYKPGTIRWLRKHFPDIAFSAFYFRKDGDYRDDTVVKKDMLDQMRLDGFNPVMAFDDRQKVVVMWVENGIFVFDVAQGKGNF